MTVETIVNHRKEDRSVSRPEFESGSGGWACLLASGNQPNKVEHSSGFKSAFCPVV